MPRPPNPKTPEAKALTAAIEAKGLGGKARVADALSVSPGLVSQYASGHRPVPWDRAEELAAEVGLSPQEISAEYRRIIEHFGASHAQRPTTETIIAAVRLASGANTGVGLTSFEIETEEDAELFALAIEEVLDDRIAIASDSDVQRFARKLELRRESGNGQVGTFGSNGGADSAKGKAKAWDAKGSSPGGKRKRA